MANNRKQKKNNIHRRLPQRAAFLMFAAKVYRIYHTPLCITMGTTTSSLVLSP